MAVGILVPWNGYPAVQHYREQIATHIETSKQLVPEAIRALKDQIADQEEQLAAAVSPAVLSLPNNKIFLVHGRDDAATNEIALFLRAIGLEPIILHLRPNGGRHLLTKFREESEGAGFAVFLMTPDDEGSVAGADDRRPRARQNVVFELGFFIGKLGSANVAALLKGDVEKPSDFDGIAYIPFDSSGRWKTDLARELPAIGPRFARTRRANPSYGLNPDCPPLPPATSRSHFHKDRSLHRS
jgi:predicted nucleotide-binding protein